MASARIRVAVIQAWPRQHEMAQVELDEGATVDAAIAAAGLAATGYVCVAIHGEKATGGQLLCDGDRVELLRALTIDPKDARRRRAGK